MHPTARAYKGQPRPRKTATKTILDQPAAFVAPANPAVDLETFEAAAQQPVSTEIEDKLLTTNVSKDKLAAANALSELVGEYREKLESPEPLDQVTCLQIHARMFAVQELYESLD